MVSTGIIVYWMSCVEEKNKKAHKIYRAYAVVVVQVLSIQTLMRYCRIIEYHKIFKVRTFSADVMLLSLLVINLTEQF